MIEVRSPLEMRADPKDGWQLTFWILDAFNYTTPFRTILADIAEALGQDPQTDLHLPAYEAYEDFIEGTLQFGTAPLRIYYEHSLSYLSLMCDSEAVLRNAAERIQPHIALVRRPKTSSRPKLRSPRRRRPAGAPGL
jgi:hypothetical protein